MTDIPGRTERKLSNRQRVFVEEYLKCFNASEAARRSGYNGASNRVGPRLLSYVGVKAAIEARIDELTMGADEMLINLTEHGRANIGEFFKVVETTTLYPAPTQEIISAEKIFDPLTGKDVVMYRVRQVVIDIDKVVDPQYGKLINEFSDSPRSGLKIKLYDKHSAYEIIAKLRGLVVNKTDLTSDGKPIVIASINPELLEKLK